MPKKRHNAFPNKQQNTLKFNSWNPIFSININNHSFTLIIYRPTKQHNMSIGIFPISVDNKLAAGKNKKFFSQDCRKKKTTLLWIQQCAMDTL